MNIVQLNRQYEPSLSKATRQPGKLRAPTNLPRVPFKQQNLGRTAGASLLEVVAGVGLLTIIVVSVLLFLPYAIFSQAKAGRLYQANSIATSLLEQSKSQPFNSFTIGETRDLTGKVIAQDIDYKAELKVLDPGLTEPKEKDYLKEIVITVRWQEKEGQKVVTRAGYVSKIQR